MEEIDAQQPTPSERAAAAAVLGRRKKSADEKARISASMKAAWAKRKTEGKPLEGE